MECPECRARFTPRRMDQGYCSSACNAAANARELKRARRVYRALYHWRLPANRRVGKGIAENLAFICREIRAWHKEDEEAQRRPPPRHAHDADRGHQRPVGLPKL